MAGTQAFWIDARHEGAQERYGEGLRRWRHAFAPAAGETAAGGITLDPLHFALSAWEVATRPMAETPYVRWHPRVLDATCHRPEETRGPLTAGRLPTPTRARADGLPNLDDAQASLEALVGELNDVVAPFLRELETS